MAPPSESQGGGPVPSAPPRRSVTTPEGSLSGLRYPAQRDLPSKGTGKWMEDRRRDDGAEGLWRVHDTLYDFSDFLHRHPGGKQWLKLTAGTDITEAFESHHVSPMPSRMLKSFEVRPAKTPRNSPYTFTRDGFYDRLRRRVYAELPDAEMRGASLQSRLFVDTMLFLMVVLALQAAARQSVLLAVLAGNILGMNTVAAHNFLHVREHWRRYYFDLSMLSSSTWRVSHSLSHHLFPNTVGDLEVSLAEPMFQWLPSPNKNLVARFVSWLYCPIIYSFIFPWELARRVLLNGFKRTDLLPFILPAAMLLWSPQGHAVDTLALWAVFVLSGSLYFGLIGFNAAHHHPEIFHDGDAPRADRDWGLQQLDAVLERSDISGVVGSWQHDQQGKPVVSIDHSRSYDLLTFMKVMVTFGHHAMHHLFPCIDHARLPQLYPALALTLTEFGVPFTTSSFGSLMVGQFRQLANRRPNLVPPPYLPSHKP